MKILDLKVKEGRKLASFLCKWVVFIDEISDVNRDWLLTIAPYAEGEFFRLLKELARISIKQPFEVQRIWLEILAKYCPAYPEESIKQILSNLIAKGPEGKRKAEEVVDAYIKHGNEQPKKWLKEMTTNH